MSLRSKIFSQISTEESYIYIAGWKEVSLVDVLEHSSFTLWTSFCNFNCPWCSNSILAKGLEKRKTHINVVIEALERTYGFVDFFHVTGGEPTLQLRPLERLLKYSKKNLGLKTSIATNGSNPAVVEKLTKVLDHIALDVKAPLNNVEKYSKVVGLPQNLTKTFIPRIIESIRVSMNIPFVELRTTMVPELIDVEDVVNIANDIEKILPKSHGRVVFVVQQFIPYENILNEEYRRKPRTNPEKVAYAAREASKKLSIPVYYRTLEHGTKKA